MSRRPEPTAEANARGLERRRFLATLLGMGGVGVAAVGVAAAVDDDRSSVDDASSKYVPLAAGLPSYAQVPAGAVFFWDDFARSDRNLDRDVAPTGQQYNIDFDSGDTQLWISGGRMVRHRAASFGERGSPSLVAPLLSTPARIAARYVFTAAPAGSAHPALANAVIGATDTGFADQSVQFAVYPSHCELFTTHTRGSDSGIITILESVSYDPPLVQDGETVYESVLTVDLAESSVTIQHPGGTMQHRDPTIAHYWGRNAHYQIRRSQDDSPDVRYLSISAASPAYERDPKPIGGSSIHLHLPGTDRLSFPSCPALADWKPSGDLDLRIKCRAVSWAGNPAGGGQGLISSWLRNRRCWLWYVKPDRSTGFTIVDGTGANQAMGVTTAWPAQVRDDKWVTLRLTYWNNYQASGDSRATIWYSLDDGATWVEVAHKSKGMGTPGLTNGLAPIAVGNAAISAQPNVFNGDLAWAEVYDGVEDGVGAPTLLARLDASAVWARYAGTTGYFLDGRGNKWGLGGYLATWATE